MELLNYTVEMLCCCFSPPAVGSHQERSDSGCRPAEGAAYVLVGKGDDTVTDDSLVGFEGVPDANTGYYCNYVDGRLAQFGSAKDTSSSKSAGGVGESPSKA